MDELNKSMLEASLKTAPKLIDRNYKLIYHLSKLAEVLRSLTYYESIKGHAKLRILEANEITDYLLYMEQNSLSPSTMRLKNQINNALLENQYGDGVIVRILKNKASKIEKCSLLNFYINEK